MQSNLNRIKDNIETLATFTDTPGFGVTRFSYGEKDKLARKYLTDICKDLGLLVKSDAVGNIFAVFEGKNPSLKPIMTGSHIDSVKNGGRFDGIVGAIGALEAVRVMRENGYTPERTIEIVFFAEEEGSNFWPVLGSKALTGKVSPEELKHITAEDGKTAYDLIKEAGFNPDDIPNCAIKKGDLKAMIELHVEQSVRLDLEDKQIGIVEGIAGMQWLEVTITGTPNHAGATPMHLRNDPMVAAAEIISVVGNMAREAAKTTVATVGKISVEPNIPNCIPGVVKFYVDVRDIDKSGVEYVVKKLHETAKEKCDRQEVSYKIEKISETDPISVADYLKEALIESAEELKANYILMPSGAVHDSNYMAGITDVAMIFVPSIDGRSHVPEENTKYEDIKLGCDLLLNGLLKLCGQ